VFSLQIVDEGTSNSLENCYKDFCILFVQGLYSKHRTPYYNHSN